jgi:Mrp family chromosome partitioning ATPase
VRPIPPNPPELLGGDRFKRFLAEARESDDWVLIDSPPAASLSDATLLAQLPEVVQSRPRTTPIDFSSRSISALRTSPRESPRVA